MRSPAVGLVIACWGCHGDHLLRGRYLQTQLRGDPKVHVFGLTQDGHPKHPLYLRKDLEPVRWTV